MSNYSINNLLRDTIKTMKPYASARSEFSDKTKQMIYLDANENPFENGLNRYPDPQQEELKQVLSKIKNKPVDQMLLGNGSDEILDLIIRAFCEPNIDSMITLEPSYGMYEVLANLNAVQNIKATLDLNFQPRVESILNRSEPNTKLLFLCSPNNPTANSYDTNIIEELLMDFRGLVIIDEAYIDFSEAESWLSRLDEFPNLIVVQTLSKAYGMAALRLGMAFASKEIIGILNRIKPPYNINTLTQKKALETLQNVELIQENITVLLQERTQLAQQLKTISWIKTVFPSNANFLLIKVDDANKRYKQLCDRGLVVRNRTNQVLCDNCLRITIGTSKENQKLINTIKLLS